MHSLSKIYSGRWFIFLALSLLVIEIGLFRIISLGVVPVPFCQSQYSVDGLVSNLSLSSDASKLAYQIFKIWILAGLVWFFIFARTFTLSWERPRSPFNYAFIWLAHVAALLALSLLRANQRGACFNAVDPNQPILLAGFFISALVLAFTLLLIFAPLDYWVSYFKKYIRRISIALLIVIGLSILVMQGFNALWVAQHYHDLLFRWTIYFVTNFLGQLGFPSSVNAILHEITVNDFTIIIAPSCLGYQGMMIALAALGFYFMIYRKNYIFPNVLLLFPIVVLTLFIANCLRIAVLLIVGAMGSPDIALNGFHVVAGWLNLLIIMGASILLVNRLPFFAKDATGFTLDLSQDKVRLAPEVLLILVSLVSLLATAKFEWAYPLRVIIVGAVLWRWWPRLGLVFSHKLFLSVIAGVIVFALWLALVPTDATRSAEFHQTLTSVPVWLMLVWMVFRLLGAVVVVPLAEELAFRGYLFDATGRLLKQTIPSFSFSYSNSLSEPNGFSDHSDGGYAGNANSSWLQTILVLAITSIGFGILHSAWLAGILAGVAFGLVRLYRNNLMDAVIAHGVTNLLLAVYVMSTGAWSLW